jgi:hypothetical protein
MDTTEIIATVIVCAVAGLVVSVGIVIVCLKRRAEVAVAAVTAIDLESPSRPTGIPHPPSVNDMTFCRCA